ncbi:MAG: SGNH/GDSL hydrolase family protein [Clostridia bacterium]|nr:SGNH/GDSL hydrolase family protein [Clostridia bacterium]
MKKVFLVGDSIRLGYDSCVRDLLENEAQVYWSNENARFVMHTLRYLHEWAQVDCDPEKIDVVHWNNGLWDALLLTGDGTFTPIEHYEHALHRIAKRMKTVFPNAKIIFGLTTSVVTTRVENYALVRRNEDIEAFNEAARRVMKEEGVFVNDLYAVSSAMPDDMHTPEGVHFTPEGYKLLAEHVVKAVREVM